MWNTCDLYDQFEGKVQTNQAPLVHYGGNRAFCGVLDTVECFEDNVLLRQALEEEGKGRVLVVQGHGSRACALMGDIIAAVGMNNGWSGVVINGMIRDVGAISKLDWGVMALGSNPAKSRKLGIGARKKAIRFGGVYFEPGAYIYCDEDGILIGSQKLHNL